jgi:TetR/AcrR family transcriptional repressor of nem operon
MTEKTYPPKAIEILDAAERHMRRGGFDAVSFRELAAETGVKSASVHYHFPQKADLGEAVVARYAGNILANLGEPVVKNDAEMKTAMQLLVATYRAALFDGDAVCLCCMLGSEAQHLPEKVAAQVALFFEKLQAWVKNVLSQKYAGAQAAKKAAFILSSLQGAMTIAIGSGDKSLFEDVVGQLTEAFNWDS